MKHPGGVNVWPVLTALVIAASGAFATWTFGWRDGDARNLEADRARAAVFAAAGVANSDCTEARPDEPCRVHDLRHRGGPVWTFRYGEECAMVDVDDFKIRAERWHGIAPIACAARDEG